jgi:hypothetical protein
MTQTVPRKRSGGPISCPVTSVETGSDDVQPLTPEAAIRRARFRTCFLTLVVTSIVCMFASANFSWPPSLPAVVHLTAIIYLCSLAGYWLGLGHSVFRIPAAILACIAIGFLFMLTANKFRSTNDAVYLMFATGITLLTGTACFLMNLAARFGDRSVCGPAARSAIQFQIRHLLAWTTVVAVLIVVFRWSLTSGGGLNTGKLFQVLTMTVAFALMAVTNLWAFNRSPNALRSGLAVIVVLISGLAILQVAPGHHLFWFFVTGLNQALLCFSLYCMRQQQIHLIQVFG